MNHIRRQITTSAERAANYEALLAATCDDEQANSYAARIARLATDSPIAAAQHAAIQQRRAALARAYAEPPPWPIANGVQAKSAPYTAGAQARRDKCLLKVRAAFKAAKVKQ